MSVERKKDGSIAIKSNTGVTVIGRIIGTSNNKHQERFTHWVDECAKLVTPCAHTMKETEQYFLEQCDAIPLAPNDRRVRNFQCNVIMNYCKDKLKHKPSEFAFDMTDEEMEKWQKEQDAVREEAMNSPAERFGLKIHGTIYHIQDVMKLFTNRLILKCKSEGELPN